MNHRIPILIISAAIALISGLSLYLGTDAHAANASDFNPGHIIDDSVFYNGGALSADQIQQFLNSKVPNCDTNGTQSAADWGYPGITHAQLAEYKRNGTNGFKKDTGFHAPPYTCLRNYSQATPQMEAASGYCNAISAGNRTAAQIIKDVGVACGINPAVLIVLLDKEQSLITDNWPLQRQYNNATGFACPDTAPCDPSYAGFFYQVYYAARQFKVYKANPNNYNYIAGRYNNIYWSPTLSCGSSSVYIENQATAGLYIYTPYRPNQAALDNLYGTGDSCSAYGNRNFWRTFTDWFGSTTRPWDTAIADRYNALSANMKASLGSPVGTSGCYIRDGGCAQQYQGGYIVGTASTGYWESLGPIRDKWRTLNVENGPMGYPTGPIYQTGSGYYQQYQSGYIVGTPSTGYWESMGDIRGRWAQMGYENGSMGYPTSPVYQTTKGGYYQQYQNGYIVGSSSTGWWESMNGPIRDKWLALGAQDGQLGFPIAPLECDQPNSGCKQRFQGGTVYWNSTTGAWQVWGSIGVRYSQLGAAGGSLGYPVDTEVCGTIKNRGCFQQYQGGYIVGSSSTGWWESTGGIRDEWRTLGGFENGTMGYALGPVYQTASGGYYQQYQGGYIIGTPSTGYKESMGDIRGRWAQMGYETSILGYPTGAIYQTSKSGYYQQYQNGYIVGSSSTGWWESMNGSLRNRWLALAAQDGKMGFPLSAQLCSLRDNGCYQLYQGGYLVGSPNTGYWESYGAIRNKWGSLGFETSTAGYPTGPVTCTGNSCSQTYEHGTIISDGSGTRYTP